MKLRDWVGDERNCSGKFEIGCVGTYMTVAPKERFHAFRAWGLYQQKKQFRPRCHRVKKQILFNKAIVVLEFN